MQFNSIRLPLVLGHALFAGLLLLLAWLAVIFSFRPGLEKIESEAAASLVERFNLEIQTEIHSVERLATDWAVWNDMYEFIENQTPKFVEANVVPSMFRNAKLNALAVYDLTGKVILAKSYDPAANLLKRLSQFDHGQIPDNFRFTLDIKKGDKRYGLWTFNGQPSLFTAKAVTDSDEAVEPNGFLVMAVPLDEAMLQAIGKKLHVEISMHDIQKNALVPVAGALKIVPTSETITEVYTTLSDAVGTPQRLIRLDMPRVLYGIGWKSVQHTITIALFAIIALTVGLVVFTKYLVSIPLQKLSETVSTIGEAEHSEDLQRLPVERNDEIGIVARSVKKMHERILFLANHDVLTQLPNRKVFRSAFDQAYARRGRQTDRLGVLVLDLDGFKPINDTYGHPAGDRVLQVVAQRLRQTVRENDMVARTGGDEFAILCVPVLSDKDMEAVAHKIMQITEPPIMLDDGQDVYIGMSIGGCFVTADTTLDQALSAADTALYEAKKAGKNTYRIAGGHVS
jgi:diguanylate cyclase (GGDEF)-like protein